MMYVATNSEVHHLTADEGAEGSTLCGVDYTGESASVVTMQPFGTRLCLTCEGVLDGSR